MDRITTPSRIRDLFGPGKDGFGDGVPSIGGSSTQLNAAWFNNDQEEICNAIELSGFVLDPADRTQLYQAMRAGIDDEVPDDGVIYARRRLPGQPRGLWVPSGRLRIDGDIDFYVSETGDDNNNDGLSPGTPFRHPQRAWDELINFIDLNGFNAVIHVEDGLYSEGINCASLPLGYGSGNSIRFTGNTTNPQNCLISVSDNYCFQATNGARITIEGFGLTNNSPNPGAGVGLSSVLGSTLIYGNCDFGPCATHILSGPGSTVYAAGAYTISAGAVNHYGAVGGTITMGVNPVPVTLIGNPAFSDAFARCVQGAGITTLNLSFNGTATGLRFIVALVAYIQTYNGGDLNFFPGDQPGVQDPTTGGYYL
jgi:hypothetical protein